MVCLRLLEKKGTIKGGEIIRANAQSSAVKLSREPARKRAANYLNVQIYAELSWLLRFAKCLDFPIDLDFQFVCRKS